jgi:hypothetical protein
MDTKFDEVDKAIAADIFEVKKKISKVERVLDAIDFVLSGGILGDGSDAALVSYFENMKSKNLFELELKMKHLQSEKNNLQVEKNILLLKEQPDVAVALAGNIFIKPFLIGASYIVMLVLVRSNDLSESKVFTSPIQQLTTMIQEASRKLGSVSISDVDITPSAACVSKKIGDFTVVTEWLKICASPEFLKRVTPCLFPASTEIDGFPKFNWGNRQES